MAAPINIAAIDAGSNAIRLLVAHAESATNLQTLAAERCGVRLGHHAFTRHMLAEETIGEAVRAFREFRATLDKFNVTKYRAVATSATREAANRDEFLRRVQEEAGIVLEVIDGEEEAGLVRAAVMGTIGRTVSPRLIVDLGGGSLEINVLRGGTSEPAVTIPVGTVRLMESFDVRGAMSDREVERVRGHIVSMLQSYLPRRLNLAHNTTVACGGNAEALSKIAAGEPDRGVPTVPADVLEAATRELLSLSVADRMKRHGVRQDRAEVVGLAGIVFSTLASYWRIPRYLVPGVGVREGLLSLLVREHFREDDGAAHDPEENELLAAARRFAARLHSDTTHAEHVRRLSLALFDQTRSMHQMGPDMRHVLELGALLHDVGHFINNKDHNLHAEYLVRHGRLQGLKGRKRDLVARLVALHDPPSLDLGRWLDATGLDRGQRRCLKMMSAILRIADGLDGDRTQPVEGLSVRRSGKTVRVEIAVNRHPNTATWGGRRNAGLFEKEFGVKMEFVEVDLPAQPAPEPVAPPATAPESARLV